MSKYKEIRDNNIIKINKFKEKNELKLNNNQNKINNKKSPINYTNKKDNITNRNKNINNKNLLNNHSNKESKSFINIYEDDNKDDKNLIRNIRYNRYLIPMIEKKNIEKKIYRKKIKDTPLYISEFFSKVRQKSERNRTESEKNKNNNNLSRNNLSFDNVKNNSINNNKRSYININNNNFGLNHKIIDIKESNNYPGNIKEERYTPFFTENNINNKYYKIVYLPKNYQIKEPSYLINNNNINNNVMSNDKTKHMRCFSTLTNKDLYDNINESDIINNEERIIYPKIQSNYMDNFDINYYLKNINIKEKNLNRKDIKIDFENYLQNKKLFLIYRAKLFKLLYKSLVKFFNNHFLTLKHLAFKYLKQFSKCKTKKLIHKEKILHRIFPQQNNINNVYKKNKFYFYNQNKEAKKINMKFNNNINNNLDKNKKRENNNLNSSMITSRNCVQFIKRKNQSESKRRLESSEMCRNINDLKEKYEEIQKRKFLEYCINKNNIYNNKNKKITNLIKKNKKPTMMNNNISKYIYKKKKLENYNDKYYSNNINHKRSISNRNKKINYNTESDDIKTLNINRNISNSLEKKRYFYPKHEINKLNILNRLYNINKKNKKETKNKKGKIIEKDQNDLNKLNKFCIRKIIKNIKSSDKRLFVNINYVYLSNIDMKGKKIKYNENLLEIKNSDNFSIMKKANTINMFNRDKSICIIEEEDSSVINYTDSANSVDFKKGKKIRNNLSNSIINQSISINDKHLFSCVNFISKNIRKVIIKNSYNFFKKKINMMNKNK